MMLISHRGFCKIPVEITGEQCRVNTVSAKQAETAENAVGIKNKGDLNAVAFFIKVSTFKIRNRFILITQLLL
jgi:hypothetical protein